MNKPPSRREPDSPGHLTAREAARGVLAGLRPGGADARDCLDDLLETRDLPAHERGLAYELVMGVLRHRLTLRHVLGVISGREWKNVQRGLQPVLLLGAYQLLYLDGIPPFAAVNESVEQAKKLGCPAAGRFVNALLRGLDRRIEHRRIEPDRCDPTRAIPVEPATCCQLRDPVLPSPSEQPIDHLALSTSHPIWLVTRWVKVFGWERAREICTSGMSRPPTLLRPNRLRTDVERLHAALEAEGIDCVADASDGVIVLPRAVQVARTRAFEAGLFQVQDRTAMGVARAMQPSPGATIVDLCAGPGTKTTQLAEMMADRGTILAGDKDDGRLALVRDGCQRLGVTCVRTVLPSEREVVFGGLARLDWILVDAPCSNTGVLARRPEARYRLNERALASLDNLQKELLTQAVRYARPETRLAYSTCSLEVEENEEIVAWFAREHPEWRPIGSCRSFPSADPVKWRDGGFWATWERG